MGMYKVMTIRRLVRDQDDKDWTELSNITETEFRKSMQDPEFDDARARKFRRSLELQKLLLGLCH
jgi:hypothetical protein